MHVHATGVFCIIFVVVFLTGSTNGLRCYECKSDIEPACANNVTSLTPVSIDPTTGGACRVCMKTFEYGVVKRHCSSLKDPSSPLLKCTGDSCGCKTDLCNASVTMATSLTSLVVSLIFSVVV
ncbi:uncharacterized protein LOC127858448 [Dreissena polymorpha]|uniref:Protein quiver n=1 Tax=Dreissena polymorpha TaxID=45954 RepID=A0A9D3Z2G3_DREPO|nr:uncharacterized protein LOC127858448 [Dreissena polymorpha]KAH3710514.1 hypothetical protein DPMN_069998 [Dreissena polymorpha]